MRFKLNLGMRFKLVAVFCTVTLAISVAWIKIHSQVDDIETLNTDQENFVNALSKLKDIDQDFAEANLLGMDIIVDHYEDPSKRVDERLREYQELNKAIQTSSEVRLAVLSRADQQAMHSDLYGHLSALMQAINSLINAINAGEKDPKKYAAFDEQIDTAKVKGSELVAKQQAELESKFHNVQLRKAQLTTELSYTIAGAFIVCLMAVLGWGTPVIILITRAIVKLQQRLSQIAASVQGTSQELSSSSETLAAAATETAAAIQESVSSMTQMNAMLSHTSRNSNETAELSQIVMDQAHHGVQVMEEMAASMKAISDSSARLKEIVQIIENIAAKTNIINDVVFKTQLLAVNASIEAARAGHHGKGFAVVANEVASLAALSGKAASEIRELLASSSAHVAGIIEKTAEAIKEGAKSSEKSSAAFEQISKSVTTISDKVEQISAASKEQDAGVAQTSMALGQMNKSTAATNNLAQRNAKLSTDLASHAEHLKQVDMAMNLLVYGHSEAAGRNGKLLRLSFKTSGVARILEAGQGAAPAAGSAEKARKAA